MNLNDTPSSGPLTAADFDFQPTTETDKMMQSDFPDTMAMPRRASNAMEYEQRWYRDRAASVTDESCTTAMQSRFRLYGAWGGVIVMVVSAGVVIGAAVAAIQWVISWTSL